MSRLWGWIAAAGASVVAVLVASLQHMTSQRDKARDAQRTAEARIAAEQATRSAEKRIRNSQQAAREQVIEQEKKRDERPKTTRPSGSFRRR